MFLTELMPVLKELSQQPLAFMGGFCSGLFRLNLTEDPVKSWLNQQAGVVVYSDAFGRHIHPIGCGHRQMAFEVGCQGDRDTIRIPHFRLSPMNCDNSGGSC